MRSSLKRSLQFVFRHEGGWGNDPHDRGNWTTGVIGKGQNKGTKYGIAAHVYPTLDIKNLTLEDATQIYARDYAPKVAFDLQPVGVDHTQLDIAINAGPARANSLQAKAFGLKSASATSLAQKAAVLPDKVPHIKRVNALMLSFYQGLSTFPRYGPGWTRRNTEREAISVKWALEAANANVPAELGKEEKRANDATNGNAGAGTASGGAGAGGATQADPATFDPTAVTQWLPYVVIGIAVVAVLYFAWHAYRNAERKRAYALVKTTGG